MPTTSTIAIQSKITRYTLKERIGAGGMATVYQAWDNNLERDVAIKVLHEHLSFDNTFQERFEREAKFVAGFHHPHIVQIFDFAVITTDDIPILYMVMPYLKGSTLEDVIATHRQQNIPLPNETIISLIREIASALDYAHERDMIHRDVKPANILYDSHNRAILTDFGIARLVDVGNLTAEGMTVGTPAYMPPEQAQGLEIDHRADIYSLGVIAYELITLTPPYGEGSVSVMLQHINAPVPQISQFLDMQNASLDAVIHRVLAKEPDDRYHTATEFAEDLIKALNNKPISNPPQPTKVFEAVETATTPESQEKSKRPVKQSTVSSSPLGLLAMGLGLVAFVLVIALLSQSSATTLSSPMIPTLQTLTGSDVAESMTGNFYFETSFAEEDPALGAWDISDTQFITREIIDNQYVITNSRANTATTSLFDQAYTYDNVLISVDAHLVNAESLASGYGIVFRYVDEENYNVFAVDGRGRFSIWIREEGQWRELRNADSKWTDHEAIMTGTTSNNLTIEIYENTLTGLVNGIEVAQVEDDTIAQGGVGIYLATTPQGEATIEIDRFAISESFSPVSAMTDNDNFTEAMTDEDNDLTTNP